MSVEGVTNNKQPFTNIASPCIMGN